ncbi:MAG: hypothetical protein WA633_09980 [Stellaceae bacterium]
MPEENTQFFEIDLVQFRQNFEINGIVAKYLLVLRQFKTEQPVRYARVR